VSGNGNGNNSNNGLYNLLNGLGNSPSTGAGQLGPLFNSGSSTTDPYPSAAGGSLASLNAKVYTGPQPVNNQNSLHASTSPQIKTIQQLLDAYYGKTATDTKSVLALGNKLASAGYMNPTAVGDISATGLAYRSMLELAARMRMTGTDITPDDLMAKGAAGMAVRPQNYTSTTRDVNLTDPTQARQMLIQSLQDQLGRNPSPSEYQAFLGSLHAAERQNPTVTTRQYKLNAGTGQYDVGNSTTSGGVDPSAYTAQYGQSANPHEHAAYQAATSYYDAMIGALKAVV
jgi:hypothetical protein